MIHSRSCACCAWECQRDQKQTNTVPAWKTLFDPLCACKHLLLIAPHCTCTHWQVHLNEPRVLFIYFSFIYPFAWCSFNLETVTQPTRLFMCVHLCVWTCECVCVCVDEKTRDRSRKYKSICTTNSTGQGGLKVLLKKRHHGLNNSNCL